MRLNIIHLIVGLVIGTILALLVRVLVVNPLLPGFAESPFSVLLTGFIAVFVAFQYAARFAMPVDCGVCGRALPRRRKPVSREGMFRGGWVCPHCGSELRADGQPMA